MWQERVSEFVTLFAVVSPFTVLPVFLSVAGAQAPSVQRRIAVAAVLVAFGVLAFFMAAGGFLLQKMGVSLRAFQIAGGIVLFVYALEMVRGESHAPDHAKGPVKPLALAISPLAIPKIAGPGAMLSAVLLTDDHRFDVLQLGQTVLVLAVVLAIQLLLLLAAVPVSRLVGEHGASIMGRVMGMLLAAVAVTMVLGGIGSWLGLPTL